MKITRFSERTVEFALSKVDREAGVIRGVKLLGRESKNGREYTDRAMTEAAERYPGVRVYVDHATDEKSKTRGTSALFGRVVSASFDKAKESVFGDIEYLKAHPLADQITEAAERMPQTLGMSHVADGHAKRGASGKVIVESIVSVDSVDVVTTPATTRGFFESETESESTGDFNVDLKELKIDDLKTARPDLVTALNEEFKASAESNDKAKADAAKIASLTEQVETLKAAAAKREREDLVSKKLAEAKITEAAAKELRPLLIEAKDEAAIDVLIKAVKVQAKASPRSAHQLSESASSFNSKEDRLKFLKGA